ncbi:hypothetical protein WICMUC_004036 [Wickerhamomyces mucosus]|uniref:Prenylcysteine lyase domain-containing protein n=1 Tax=Wickerhamomyces mucosus TaxID=1378264 RepID=A0A9P8TBM8_9ASCO|nr:hypothetical protein WICMUC_004036 [Wickerhamomyces mucosus]
MVVDSLFLILLAAYTVIGQYSNSSSTDSNFFNGPKIAIIGAGPGGSSAAYHLQKFTSNGFNITIFEKNNYVGGRSTTIENFDSSVNSDLELGASIFTSSNQILLNAVETFGLEAISSDEIFLEYPTVLEATTGIWDGTSFLDYLNPSAYSSAILEYLYYTVKYGFSFIKFVFFLGPKIIDLFLQNYYYSNFPYKSLTDITKDIGFDLLTGETGLQYLRTHGISDKFSKIFIEATTRVNYASNIDDITGLEALVSGAGSSSGAYQVYGGNYQIFENFIESSGSSLRLNNTIQTIKSLGSTYEISSLNENGEYESESFDKVIIAAPFHLSNITIDKNGYEISDIPDVEYRELYVTFVKSSTPLNNAKLVSASPDGTAPFILATSVSETGTTLDYYSVSIVDYDDTTGNYTYKIFSESSIDDNYLLEHFFDSSSSLEIIFQHHWNPYPHLTPITEFLDFEIGENLYYLNTIEQFISTMETAALAGANVAGLISKGLNTTAIELPNSSS